MEREIKFRAWNKFTKEMKSVDRLRFDAPIMEIQFMGNTYPYTPNPDDLILMQYTGLKDKNGKEIYEGDIISYRFSKYSTRKYIVKYSSNAFVLNRVDRPQESLNVFAPMSCKVIGNIYGNKDLLNE